jgi:hypothetical protein
MKDHVPKDEIKKILKTDNNDQKGNYKVKNEKSEKFKHLQDQQSIEIELIPQLKDSDEHVSDQIVNPLHSNPSVSSYVSDELNIL